MSFPRHVASSSGHLAHVGISLKPGHDDMLVTTASQTATRARITIIDRIVAVLADVSPRRGHACFI
jgi:hypothetical protein